MKREAQSEEYGDSSSLKDCTPVLVRIYLKIEYYIYISVHSSALVKELIP